MNIRFSYGDKKTKRMWVMFFIPKNNTVEEEVEYGYYGSIEIGLNKGMHTYTKGVWCYDSEKDKIPLDWEDAINTYNIDFNKCLDGALQYAMRKGYCK